MKYLGIFILSFVTVISASNNCSLIQSVGCPAGELKLRSGACVTDCGCFLQTDKNNKVVSGESRYKACVANQLGKGEHNYYVEIPSDCMKCRLARSLKKSKKK